MSLILILARFPAVLAQEVAPVVVTLGPAESREGGRRIWKTSHFELESIGQVPESAVKRLAVLGESTAAALKAFALPVAAPPTREMPKISIFAEGAAYEQAGAAKGSAGFYLGRGQARVLIRADYFLNAVVAHRTARTPTVDEDLAVHELVHLGMHEKMERLPPWFIDGIAEYFAAAHSGGGRF
ncbi:hypothetical protein JIN85_02310 [Luteolibacter pohnpeiensis]|uniref:Uncharacterized protein n=1 Tax=Luteolibacter pohnpeiensis TaxID=454153 RepID=A0A934VUY0_9BACT|nr:hypothetical protein [Luteolibacter pohnpeiensis]MBK1881228.1 hypothetical protein [Luteolibacter pohnpeiensis]